MRYTKLTLFVLSMVLLLAFFLRFYKVTEVPPSLNWDEVSIGYNAFSILKTGKDEWGKTFPLHFKSYGEYKLPGQIYASIPAIGVFGLNDFGVRITPVIYGTLTVLLIFLLARQIFQNQIVALLSTFLLAISPWHIQFTRASFESSFALMWVVLGLYFLTKGFKDSKFFYFSAIPFALSLYTYNSERIFTPIFLLAIFLIYFRHFKKNIKVVLLSGLFFLILLLPLAPFVLTGGADARYKLVSITDDPGLLPRVNENRGNSKLPSPLPRIVHNKITYVSMSFAQNYIAHFSPDFLFISGAPHKQHSAQGIGELYLFQAPFLLFGIYLILKKKNFFRWLLLVWLFLGFIPAAITNDSIPNALRTLTVVPFYQLLSGYGIFEFYMFFKRRTTLYRIFLLGGIMLVFLSVSFYSYNYFQIYPIKYSRDWQYGNKQAVEYIKDHKDEYDIVVFSRTYGEPQMFTLFYLSYNPAKYQNDPNLTRFETYDWIRVLRFDKFYFPDLGDQGTKYQDILFADKGKRILFIGAGVDFPSDANVLKSIYFLNGDLAFKIVAKN